MADVAIIGLGRLGLPLAASFASRGFKVVGADSNARARRLANRVGANLFAVDSVRRAVQFSETTIVLVNTPSEPDGSFSLRHVLQVCKEIGEALRRTGGYHLVIISSTVMPGSCTGSIRRTLERESGKLVGEGLGLCYSPEFVAQGSAVQGFLEPDFVIVGESDLKAGSAAERMYRRLCRNDPPIHRMSLTSAEIAKIGLNVAVVMKMAAAAQITWMCQRYPGADAGEVLQAIGGDPRIGHKFFSKTLWAGGPCFPRDGQAFARAARNVGQFAPVAEAVAAYLDWQVGEMAALVDRYANGGQIGILGLTYKSGVNSIDGSYGLALADRLTKMQQSVKLCDPYVPKCRGESTASLGEAVESCAVLVVAVDHPEFKVLENFDLSGKVVVDCRGFLNESKISGEYVRQGRGI